MNSLLEKLKKKKKLQQMESIVKSKNIQDNSSVIGDLNLKDKVKFKAMQLENQTKDFVNTAKNFGLGVKNSLEGALNNIETTSNQLFPEYNFINKKNVALKNKILEKENLIKDNSNEKIDSKDLFTDKMKKEHRYGKGNIDLLNRPKVKNKDGSISTVESISFYDEKINKEVLIPKVIDGKVVSNEEAKKHYFKTGENLGKFNTPEEATEYAIKLHNEQDQLYTRNPLLRKSLNEQQEESPVNQYFNEKINENQIKIQENIDDTTNKVMKKVNELMPSIAQSATGAVLSEVNPALGLGFFHNSAADSYYKEAKNRGMTDDEAFKFANIMGAAESGSEYIGGELSKNVGKLAFKGKAKSALQTYGLDILENFVEEAGIEPVQEIVADIIGDYGNWDEMSDRIVQSGIDGALTSLLMGGASFGIGESTKIIDDLSQNKKVNSQEVKNTLNEILKSDKVDSKKIINDNFNYAANEILNQQNGKIPSEINADKFANINQEKQANTMQNKDFLNQGQQTIQTEGKMPKKSIYEQIEEMPEIEQNLQENMQNNEDISLKYDIKYNNFKDSMKKYNLSDNDKTFDNIFKVAKTSNNELLFDDTIFKDEQGNDIEADALYLDGKIYLNPKAKDSTKTLENLVVHEAIHSKANTKEYQALKKSLIDFMKSKNEYEGARADLENLYSKVYDKTEKGFNDKIDEEVIANSLGEKFGNDEFIRYLTQNNDKTVLQKIVDWFKDIVNKLSGYKDQQQFYKSIQEKLEKTLKSDGIALDGKRESALADIKDYGIKEILKTRDSNLRLLDKLQKEGNDAWIDLANIVAEMDDYIDDFDKKNKTTYKQVAELIFNGDQHSFSKKGNKELLYSLKNQKNNKDNKGRELSKEQQEYFKNVSKELKDENGNIKTLYHETDNDFNVFDTNLKTHSQGDYEMPEGIFFKDTSEKLGLGESKNQKEVYVKIEKPLVVNERSDIKNKINNDKYTNLEKQIADNTKNYNDEFNKLFKQRRQSMQTSNMNSYKEITDKMNMLTKTYREQNNKLGNEARKILKEELISKGYDGVIVNNDYGSFNRKIKSYIAFNSNQVKNVDNIKPTNNPDIRYSLRDNKGKKLSKEQQEYFKDVSKDLRDEQGNIKTLYHVTDSDFNEFDVNKFGRNTGGKIQGIYLSEKPYGEFGDKVKELYADIKNPVKSNQKNITEDQFKALLKNHINENDLESAWKYYKNKDDITILKDIQNRYKANRNYENNQEFYDNVNKITGYDGAIYKANNGENIYVAFNSNQLKNTDNINPTKKADIRYSLKDNKDDKSLLAIHNLSADNLNKTLELGGFPVPSIAITEPNKVDHNSYGDVSVVFDKNTIDPSNSLNEVYDRDVWSPTFPKIDSEINLSNSKNVANKLGIEEFKVKNFIEDSSPEDAVYKLSKEKEVQKKYANENNIKYETAFKDNDQDVNPGLKSDNIKKYIRDNNITVEKIAKNKNIQDDIKNIIIKDFENELNGKSVFLKNVANSYVRIPDKIANTFNEELKNGRITDENILNNDYNNMLLQNYTKDFEKIKNPTKIEDTYKTEENLKEALKNTDFEKWIKENISSMYGKKGIYNNKEYLTSSGNRRTFWQLHDEYTLNNIVKALTKQNTKASEDSFFTTFGKISAQRAYKFKNLEDIRNSRNQLVENDNEINKSLNEKLLKDINTLANKGTATNSLDNNVAAGELVTEFAGKSKLTVDNFRKLTNKYYEIFKNVSDNDINKIINDLEQLKRIPTNYFEAKPQRAVGLDEIKAVVIPSKTDSKLKQQLIDKGLNVIEYDENDSGARQRILNDLNDFKFSLQGKENLSGNEWDQFINKYFKNKGTGKTLAETQISESDKIGKSTKTSSKAERYQARQENIFKNDIVKKLEVSKYINKDILNDSILRLENEFKANNDISKETADEVFNDLYKNLIKEDTRMYDEYKGLKKNLRETKLYVPHEVKADIPDYGSFRSRNLGNLTLTSKTDNINIDTYYKELSSEYPDLFPAEVSNPSDQLLIMADVGKDISKVDTNIEAYNDETLGKEYKKYAKRDFDIALDQFKAQLKIIDKFRESKNDIQAKMFGEESIENVDLEEIKGLYEARNELEKEYQKVSNKELLTKREQGIVKRLLDGEMGLEEILPGFNKEGIEKVYNAKIQLDAVQKGIKEYKTLRKEQLNEINEELLSNVDSFKDKSKGIFYKRETATRNIKDIMQKEDAERVNKAIFEPVQKNEADRIRYINKELQKVKDLNIDTNKTYNYGTEKINEADIAGLYLEKKIDEAYIVNNGIELSRIQEIANTFKGILDNAVNRMEEEYLKNGYAPVQRRKNYFPHFTENKPDTLLQKITKGLGIDTTNQELPTQIAGLTDTFKPGRTWNRNILQRKTDISDINALKVMEMYVNGASDVIYHTEDIQKLRSFENAIRDRYADIETQKRIDNITNNEELTEVEKADAIQKIHDQINTPLPNFVTWLNEYTNTLANKKSKADRSFEDSFGRQTYKTMADIEGKIASNMIGGNVGVSLTNIAPIAQAMGTTKIGNVLNGMIETTINDINEISGKGGDDLVSRSNFLTRRRGTETIQPKKITEKISDTISKPMEIIDNFASESIVRAKYQENLQKGMDEIKALDEADKYARDLMADRSKGAVPVLFNQKNPLSKALTMFQVEPNNIISNYTKDMKTEKNKIAAYGKLAAASYAFNTVLKSIRGGSNILPDPISIVSSLMKMITSDDDEEKEKAKDKVITDILGSLPFGSSIGIVAETLGIDIEGLEDMGRIPVASAIPSIKKLQSIKGEEVSPEYKKQVLEKELMKPLLFLGLPTGGAQINKTIQGLKALQEGGSYKYDKKTGNKLLQFPIEQTPSNAIKSSLFGKYATPEGQKYIESFKSLNAKQTKLYEDSKIDFNDLQEYFDYSKKEDSKDKKIEYINKLDITDKQKYDLYKYNILTESQTKSADYVLKNKMTTEKGLINQIKKTKENNIEYPDIETLDKIKNADLKIDTYLDYKAKEKAASENKKAEYEAKAKTMLPESKEKIEISKTLNNKDKVNLLSGFSNKDQKNIYKTFIDKEDETFEILNQLEDLNMEGYTDYLKQDIKSLKNPKTGKTIPNSRKNNLIQYLNSNDKLTPLDRVVIYGKYYKLSSDEQKIITDAANKAKLNISYKK